MFLFIATDILDFFGRFISLIGNFLYNSFSILINGITFLMDTLLIPFDLINKVVSYLPSPFDSMILGLFGAILTVVIVKLVMLFKVW